jgi:hypothetical protein
MPIDIKHFRVDQGGDPELIRESQRRRFADVGIVDEVHIELYAASVRLVEQSDCSDAYNQKTC